MSLGVSDMNECLTITEASGGASDCVFWGRGKGRVGCEQKWGVCVCGGGGGGGVSPKRQTVKFN